MNRAYSILTLKGVDEEKRIIRGLATTPATDRQDDIVESTGAQFTLPIPFLWQHNADAPVGNVTKAKVTKAGIEVEIQLERTDEPGLVRDRLEAAWQDIKLGLVRGLSIGFKPLESTDIDGTWGRRFVKWLWLELSGVTIAANGECSITNIKKIDTAQLAASGRTSSDEDRTTPPAPGKSKSTIPVKAQEGKKPMAKKSIADQISAFTATREAKSADMDAIMDAAAEKGETLDADGKEKYDTLIGEVKEIDDHIVRLKAAEVRNVAAAKAVIGVTEKSATESRGTTPVVQVRRNTIKGLGFVQLLAARFMAKEDGVSPAEIAMSRGWGDELVSVLRTPKSIVQKAAIAAGSTTDSTWAGPLVTYNNLQEEFIELLRPLSVISRLPGLRRVPFNIKVPRETTGTTGYWVGQGSPKPVSKGAFDTVTLDFAKVAGITFQTQELLRFSRPNSEQLMINSLTQALTYLVDRDFLDPAKAVSTGVSPASVTNGSSSVTATGVTAAAFRNDFRSVLALYTQANYSLNGLVIVMSQTMAMSLGLIRNDFGQKEFPDLNKDGGFIEGIPVVTSENIVANGGSPADGTLIAFLNANDILLADDGGVDVDISTEASIQTDSAPDSPMTASTVLTSLWQNNLVGIRCERYISWVKARTDSVVYITGGNYIGG